LNPWLPPCERVGDERHANQRFPRSLATVRGEVRWREVSGSSWWIFGRPDHRPHPYHGPVAKRRAIRRRCSSRWTVEGEGMCSVADRLGGAGLEWLRTFPSADLRRRVARPALGRAGGSKPAPGRHNDTSGSPGAEVLLRSGRMHRLNCVCDEGTDHDTPIALTPFSRDVIGFRRRAGRAGLGGSPAIPAG
jgi:hypothetical protein